MLKYGFAIKAFVIGIIIGITAVLTWSAWRARSGLSLDELFSGEEKVEDRFYAEAPKISGKQALQVAKLQQIEYIERKSSARAFWVNLPDVVVRAKVPVEFGFSVPLTAGWSFYRETDRVVVHVPELVNTTPAVDVGRMEFDVVKGSLFRSERSAIEGLRSELMGLLTERAIANRALVRDQARESVGSFVRGWLSRQTGAPVIVPIVVQFPGDGDLPAKK